MTENETNQATGTAILVEKPNLACPFWHHSVEFDGYEHTTACGMTVDCDEINEVLMDTVEGWNEEIGPANRCPECHGSVRSLQPAANRPGGESA
jgi:hypothetical protein